MTERVHRACGIRAIAIVCEEHDAGSAERQEGGARCDDTHSSRTRSVVATARSDGHGGHAPRLRDFGEWSWISYIHPHNQSAIYAINVL